MKNVIKKITATAMAFTLLGAGTTIATTLSPKSYTTLVASACSCNARRYASTKQVITGYRQEPVYMTKWNGRRFVQYVAYYKNVPVYATVSCIRCVNCGEVQ